MACRAAYYSEQYLCVHRIAIPRKYRRASGIVNASAAWFETDDAKGLYTFSDESEDCWAKYILFSDENTAFNFKMRFG